MMKLTKSTLKEMIKEELLNEGSDFNMDYFTRAIDNNYTKYWNTINALAEQLKEKGLKKEAVQLQKEYKKMVAGFNDRWLPQFIRKLM